MQQSPNLLKHNVKMWQKSEKLLPHLSHHRNHSVETPLSGSGSLHSHRQQHTPHVAHTSATESRRKTLLQSAENIGGRQADALFFGRWNAEALEEKFLLGRMLVKCLVVRLNLLLLFRCKPISLTCQKFRLQLGIELGIIRLGAIDFMGHFHTEETSATRGIGQQFLVPMNEAILGNWL